MGKGNGNRRKYRMVIILYYEQEFSTREISKILNIPEGTVRSRLARAREKLKDILEAEQSGSF